MPQLTAHRYIVTDDRILSGEPIIKWRHGENNA
jgi:hypothetical protein